MEEKELARYEEKPLSVQDVRSQVNLIQEVLRSIMIKDIHYGIIPGTTKPTLYKPGAETILSTFRIAVDPEMNEVYDLSTDDIARFRMRVSAKSQTGRFLGAAIGECSSNEEKFKWRKPVCDEEYIETPENIKREKWVKNSS